MLQKHQFFPFLFLGLMPIFYFHYYYLLIVFQLKQKKCCILHIYHKIKCQVYNSFRKQMKRKGCLIPQRELKWKKYDYLRNKENKIFYDCECGCRYVSFPAIFLHFQRKHNRKISTQQLPHECILKKTEQESVFLYFVKEKPKQAPQSSLINSSKKQQKSLKFLDSIFGDFISDMKEEQNDQFCHKEMKSIMKKFLIFLKENSLNSQPYRQETLNPTQICENLPYSFNNFVCGNEQALGNIEYYTKVCNVLLVLSRWLNEKKYTQLIVQRNEQQISPIVGI